MRIDAHLSADEGFVGQPIELTVTVEHDGAQTLDSYRAPATPDFDIQHAGNSQQVQMNMFGGTQTVRIVEEHAYVLAVPKKRGNLAIGQATARFDGQELHTKSLTLHVSPAPKGGVGQSPPPPNVFRVPSLFDPPDSVKAGDELFLDARLDKPSVYVGEQVTATWRLYTQTNVLQYRPLSEPKYEEFWSEDLFAGQQRLAWDRQVVRGQEYNAAVLMKKGLFPLKAGKLTITPLDAEATTMQSAFYANASAERKSPPLTVDVKPLPAEGRPANFEPANVGQFQLAAEIDRTTVKAGEAVTWKVTLRGSGNIRNVRLPKPTLDGFRAYDPAVKEQVLTDGDVVHGEKVYTFLVMPERGRRRSRLLALELPYLRSAGGAITVVARTPLLTINVVGDPSKLGESSVAGADKENVLGLQIRPIRAREKVHANWGAALVRGRLAVGLLAGPPALWLLILMGDGLRERLSRETARSKRRRARRAARKRMRAAEYHIKAQRPSAFFGECARALYEHLEYRLGAKVERADADRAARAPRAAPGRGKDVAEAIVKELETCDLARFAPSASGPGEMRAALRRVRTLLGLIEKARGRRRQLNARPQASLRRWLQMTAYSVCAAAFSPVNTAAAAGPAFAAVHRHRSSGAPTTPTSTVATPRRSRPTSRWWRWVSSPKTSTTTSATRTSKPGSWAQRSTRLRARAALRPGQGGRAVQNLKAAREAAKRRGEDRLVGAEEHADLAPHALAVYRRWLGVGVLQRVGRAVRSVGRGALHAVGLRARGAVGGAGVLDDRHRRGRRAPGRQVLRRRARAGGHRVAGFRRPCERARTPIIESSFGVHAGMRVRITEKEQDWVRVRLSNGLEGWLREQDLGRL